MSIFNSEQNAKAYVSEPKEQLAPYELNGRIRSIYASIVLGAEITTADVVKFCKLPANAVIISCRFIAPGGGAGTLNLGWAAGANSEGASPHGLAQSLAGSGAIDDTMDIGAKQQGYGKRFSEEVDIELSAIVDTTGFSGDKLELELKYIID